MQLETIIKRNGEEAPFDANRIENAIHMAFLSDNNANEEHAKELTNIIVKSLETLRDLEPNAKIYVEKVQDIVEAALMTHGHHKVARNYILYREQHKLARQEKVLSKIKENQLEIKINDTETIIFNPTIIEKKLRQLTPDLLKISISELIESIQPQIYDQIPLKELNVIVLSAVKERIEKDPDYAYLGSRLVIDELYNSILSTSFNSSNLKSSYQESFESYVHKAIELELLNPELAKFDLDKLSKAIQPENDKLFYYLGTQILTDRYLIKDRGKTQKIIELPQWFWMRVAMGLCLNEKGEDREKYAIEFYNVLSNHYLISSTPTLFNSGTNFSQMSSCYLNTIDDSLEGIFKQFSDNAKLSKWAGGIGTDWTNIRATGSRIKGTNGASQGTIPFLKIYNDVALAVNQGGKRKGAMCAYLEIWHADYEQFLELKKNTGDERRRTHDINTASWIPDLFMKRVENDGNWTFFCPSDVPDLHDLYGKAFETRYVEYEKNPEIPSRKIKAKDLWRKMLTMLYETGHPWITFKDPINLRSPQDHCGVVHSSNLCTEITLNTSNNETAVCNLASINLGKMIQDGNLNEALIESTVATGIRMLDNVIDNNYYPIPEAENANLKHRAIGLGMMGYQDLLFQLDVPFSSDKNIQLADQTTELISYYAIKASSDLAKERGSYESFKGSKWDRGLLPLDTLDIVEKERDRKIPINRNQTKDWDGLKQHIKENGMRHSNVLSIAPTATIANIVGVYPCTEPAFKNIYMKENLSGNFVVINRYLVKDLADISMWNKEILSKIKAHNGSIQNIDGIPSHLKDKYKETFEIDPHWIIQTTAHRMKWIDQSASTNIFLNSKSGKIISDTYLKAWELGLKTTYYLRTLGATQVQKTESAAEEASQPTKTVISATPEVIAKVAEPALCRLDDPNCEACQ